MLQVRIAGSAVLRQTLQDPIFAPAFGIGDQTLVRGATQNALEGAPRQIFATDLRPQELLIARVADHQPIVLVIKREALGDGLDRSGQLGARPGRLVGRRSQFRGALLHAPLQAIACITQIVLVSLLLILHLIESVDHLTQFVLAAPGHPFASLARTGLVDRAQQTVQGFGDNMPEGEERRRHLHGHRQERDPGRQEEPQLSLIPDVTRRRDELQHTDGLGPGAGIVHHGALQKNVVISRLACANFAHQLAVLAINARGHDLPIGGQGFEAEFDLFVIQVPKRRRQGGALGDDHTL